jgi:hypothetical protein
VPCASSDVRRRDDLRSCQHYGSTISLYARNGTYTSGETWRERDPGNEPSHYSSPVRSVLVVAIAAARVVHGVDVVRLLVDNPVVG